MLIKKITIQLKQKIFNKSWICIMCTYVYKLYNFIILYLITGGLRIMRTNGINQKDLN